MEVMYGQKLEGMDGILEEAQKTLEKGWITFGQGALWAAYSKYESGAGELYHVALGVAQDVREIFKSESDDLIFSKLGEPLGSKWKATLDFD